MIFPLLGSIDFLVIDFILLLRLEGDEAVKTLDVSDTCYPLGVTQACSTVSGDSRWVSERACSLH
jgi:hypothetical protein